MKVQLSLVGLAAFVFFTYAAESATFSAPNDTKAKSTTKPTTTVPKATTGAKTTTTTSDKSTTVLEPDIVKPEGITEEFFGIHMHRVVLRDNEKKDYITTKWPKDHVRLGSLRLWDSTTRWADITPKAGVWNFSRMDNYIAAAEANGADVLYTLGSTPQWASSRPYESCPYGFGCSAEPIRLAHWEEYVRRVVTRYKGRIKAYEIWNEPKFSDIQRDRGAEAFFTGSVQNMVDMARSASKIIKEIDPDAMVMTPGFTNGPDRLDLFLKSGGAGYIDGVTYHFYSTSTKHLLSQIAEVKDVMKANGVSHLPLWNTEDGVFLKPLGSRLLNGERDSEQGLIAFALQHFVVVASAGIQRFYYYAWDNINSGMVAPLGEKKALFDAFAQVQSWLIGAKVSECASLADSTYACEVIKGDKHYVLAWSDKPGGYKMTLPAGFNATGLESADVTVAPLTIARTNILNIGLSAMPVRISLDNK